MRYDLTYITSWSVGLDLRILLREAQVVVERALADS